MVAGGAEVVVVAGAGVQAVDAAGGGVTGIVGAGVSVLTSQEVIVNTLARGAVVPEGAGVGIVTFSRGGEVSAPLGEAGVLGAGIAVVARRTILGMDAARQRVAGIKGALIVVVAQGGTRKLARAVLAVISRSALVGVVALLLVGQVGAPHPRQAGIVGTGVGIIAGKDLRTGLAGSLAARVLQGADVAVLAGRLVVNVDATRPGLAGIVGAEVPVVAVDRRSGLALAPHALVAESAAIRVVAGQVFVRGDEGAGTGLGVAPRGQAEGMGALRRGALHHRFRVHRTLVG